MNKGRCLLLLFVWLLFELTRLLLNNLLNPSLRWLQRQQRRWENVLAHNRGVVVVEHVLGRWKMDVMQVGLCQKVSKYPAFTFSQTICAISYARMNDTACRRI